MESKDNFQMGGCTKCNTVNNCKCASLPCVKDENPFACQGGCSAVPPTRGTICGILKCDGRFDIFLRAVSETGLCCLLNQSQTITLFAPTDDAFNRLPKGAVECLFCNCKLLRQVVLTHILDIGRTVSQLALAPPMTWETLECNAQITVDFRSCPNRTMVIDPINRCAQIIESNIKACNGIIQVINNVLFPFEACCVREGALVCCRPCCGGPALQSQAEKDDGNAGGQGGCCPKEGSCGQGCGCRRN